MAMEIPVWTTEYLCRGKPSRFWATTAVSVDVVPLLKASMWRCLVVYVLRVKTQDL